MASEKVLQKYRLLDVRETGREVGRGSYAAVVEVEYKGLICAAKKLHPVLYEQGIGDLVHRFEQECELLSKLQHPHIVQFMGIWFELKKSCVPVLVMEFLPTTLAQCVEQHGHLPEEIAYSVLQDVALGLRYLHERPKPIIHRDLSANNVLLTRDMRAKISDLGVAKILHLEPKKMAKMTKGPGTPSYMPPEATGEDPRYDIKVDIFSYGVLMVHVFSGQWPVPGKSVIPSTTSEALIAVSEAGRRQKYLDHIDDDHPLMELILQCLKNRPNLRPVIAEVFCRVSDLASRFPPTFSDRIEVLERMKFEAAEKAKLQSVITEKNTEIRHLRDEKEEIQAQHQNELQTTIAALQKELETKYQITANHQEPTPNHYYDVLLLGKTGIGKSTTGNKMLGLSENSSDQCSPECEVQKWIKHNSVSMRLRILDGPGFTHDGIYEGNLKILHWIVRVQAELGMNFRRIVYFLPCRGPLEKADKVLQNELKLMYRYFRKSIFECMVLAGTNPPSMEYQTPEMKFIPELIAKTRVTFQAAMRMTTGDDTLCCPPLVYIGLSPQYTGSRIISDILSAPVQCDEGLQLTICETEDFRQH